MPAKVSHPIPTRNVVFVILVASLGYFIDIYDIVIFSIVRVQSFQDIGITGEKMRPVENTFSICKWEAC